jgi:hypothetical protein
VEAVVVITPAMVETVAQAVVLPVGMMAFQRQVVLQLAVKVTLAEIQMAQLEVHTELPEAVVLAQLVRMGNHLMVAVVAVV